MLSLCVCCADAPAPQPDANASWYDANASWYDPNAPRQHPSTPQPGPSTRLLQHAGRQQQQGPAAAATAAAAATTSSSNAGWWGVQRAHAWPWRLYSSSNTRHGRDAWGCICRCVCRHGLQWVGLSGCWGIVCMWSLFTRRACVAVGFARGRCVCCDISTTAVHIGSTGWLGVACWQRSLPGNRQEWYCELDAARDIRHCTRTTNVPAHCWIQTLHLCCCLRPKPLQSKATHGPLVLQQQHPAAPKATPTLPWAKPRAATPQPRHLVLRTLLPRWPPTTQEGTTKTLRQARA
jgi:hypothetical protein